MRGWIEQVWYATRAPPRVLRPLAALYGVVSTAVARRRRAGATRLPVPVIVVGNVAVGGTGKTPVTLWLVAALQRRGLRPGVLSRGYGGVGPFPLEVDPGGTADPCGDEPLLIARRAAVPVAVAPDRVAAGLLLLSRHPDLSVLVCDDGLQHYRLARDLEICVIDGARGHGNGYLLPAGPLRETPERTDGVDLVLVNGGDATRFGPGAAGFTLALAAAESLIDGGRRPLDAFRGAPVHAVAGIGNPQRFFDALRTSGIDVVEHPFPDHHAFTPGDLAPLGDAAVLMTEKDAVKCRPFARGSWWSVPAELVPSPAADAALAACLARLPA